MLDGARHRRPPRSRNTVCSQAVSPNRRGCRQWRCRTAQASQHIGIAEARGSPRFASQSGLGDASRSIARWPLLWIARRRSSRPSGHPATRASHQPATAARHGPFRLPCRAGGGRLPRRLERAAEAQPRADRRDLAGGRGIRHRRGAVRASLSGCRARQPGPTSWRRWRSTSSTISRWRRPTGSATSGRSTRSRAAPRR